jgi:TonB-dependent starch-binding outer membrane protein SusC
MQISPFWEVVRTLMRLTVYQLLCVVAFISTAFAHDGNAQEVLDRRISVQHTEQPVRVVLRDIERKANTRFAFSSSLISAERRITVKADNQPLSQVLTQLLQPLRLSYEITGKVIVLNRLPAESSTNVPRQDSPSPDPANVPTATVQTDDRTITGTVLGENADGLPGVSVVVKGTNKGITTDAAGKYKLTISETGPITLVFSYVGYLTQNVAVGNRNTVDITLVPDNRALNEVVVVGYGTQVRRNVTSAISQVKGTELREIVAPGLDQALQGRAPGVQVIKNTGAPGGGVSIRVRGTASLIGGQEPLYIIDGFPISNTPTGTSKVFVNNNENTGQAGFEYINPLSQIPIEDIENIEILKDAAAASIYGARAANGVVIVTTKRGKSGRTNVSLSGYTGVSYIPKSRWYNMLSGPEYAAAVNEIRTQTNQFRASQTPPLAALPVVFDNPAAVANTNWQDEVFQTAPVSELNASVNGGNDKTAYALSLGYFTQNGVMLRSRFDRFNLRTNFDLNLSKSLKTGVNLLLTRSGGNRLRNNGVGFGTNSFNNDNVYGNSVLGAALAANPAIPAKYDDGRYYIDPLLGGISPVATAENFRMENTELRGIFNAYVEWQIPFVKGLKFRTNNGVDLRYSNETVFSPQTPGVYSSGAQVGALLEKGNYNELIWLTENYLNYDLKAGRHDANFLVGFSAQESRNDGTTIRGRAIPNNSLEIISAVPSTGLFLPLRDQGHQYWGIVSQFARVNYSFNDRYLLTATVRRDGSSRFGPLNRYGVFPSASAGWIASDEPFMKRLKAISFLKIRGSYGLTGNDQLGDVFTWRSSIRLDNGGATQGYLGGSTSRPISIEVGDFGWESTRQANIGFELGLFDNRISFVTDYYNRQSRDVLFSSIPLPATTGFTTITNNVASLENKGWEFSLITRNIVSGPFRWTTNFNISTNQNKVLSLYEGRTKFSTGDFGKSTLLEVGQPISFQGVQIAGINPATGDYLPVNVSGTPDVINDDDMVVLGSPLPKHFGGLNNTFSYKNFDLNIFFNWNVGNKIFNTTRSYTELTGLTASATNPIIRNMSREAFYGRWQKPGDVVDYRGFDFNGSYRAVQNLPTDYYLEDGSFLRLRSVSLSYNLPKSLLSKLKFNSGRVYVNGNNLLLLTKYRGYDPEVNHNNVGENLAVGYDRGTYPQARTFVGGFSLTF